MSQAHAAVCLVSPNYLKTKFIVDEEIPYLLQRAEKDGLKPFFLLVEPCDWQAHYWLEKRQMFLPKGACVQTDYEGREHLPFAMLAKAIRKTVGEQVERREHLLVFSRVAEALERLEKASEASLGELADVMTLQDRQIIAPDAVRYSAIAHPPTITATPIVDLTRLPTSGFDVVGRDDELRMLDEAFDGSTLNVVSLRAWGGVGKSTLVNKWCEYLAADNFRGARRVFAWSFYSQGTNQRVTSADAFVDEALRFFGDADPSAGSPWARGERLAELVSSEKTLLVLDGMEPLQDEHQGIKDPALARLVECLAAENAGLCVITTREPVKEFLDFPEATREVDLEQLSKQAGRALLRIKGLRASDDLLERVSEAFGNHALALNLLASYLRLAQRPVEDALEIPDLPEVTVDAGKHPRRVMAAFAEQFGDGPELDLLHVMGLFDRPASADCIAALREPAVPGLTDKLAAMDEIGRRDLLDKLRKLGLLAEASHHITDELDAHPLVREHFGEGLRDGRLDAWKAGHERLYEHLKTVPEKHQPDTLAKMAPLFQAVHHGCQAGRLREALNEICRDRIDRSGGAYLSKKLGAFGTGLGLVASFFDSPFETPAAELSEPERTWLLIVAAFCLRSLGRLEEAIAPTRAALAMQVEQAQWKQAANSADHLSEVQLALGDVAGALISGKAAVEYADRSGDTFRRITNRTAFAEALHQRGALETATALFREAKKIQTECNPDQRLLRSGLGYRHRDLQLTVGQFKKVHRRAMAVLKNADKIGDICSVALDHLSLGRAALKIGNWNEAEFELDQAVDGLRKAGRVDHLPRGLLARAALFREVDNGERARKDLEEAMRIAKRCGMRLHECDAHLELSRLALAEGRPDDALAPFESAERLVAECGYHRRDGEVLDLKKKLGL